MLRAYEDGKPAKITNFLKWSDKGVTQDELVLSAGHPGNSSRGLTVSDLKFMRDRRVPFLLNWLYRREVIWQQFGNRGQEARDRSAWELFYIQNSRKVYSAIENVLQDGSFIQEQYRREVALRQEVVARPDLKNLVDAWDQIDKAIEAYDPILFEYNILEGRNGFTAPGSATRLFTIARRIVRIAEEDAKPNGERLEEYRDSNRKSMEVALYSPAPIQKEMEQVLLGEVLTYLCENLGAENTVIAEVLAGKSPTDRAAEIFAGTRLHDVAERKRLVQAGKAAVLASTDPLIKLIRALDPRAREVRRQFQVDYEEATRQAYAKIKQALFAVRGTTQYPDATFTLRLSYGTVKPFEQDGKLLGPSTTLGGLYEHAGNHKNEWPWLLPPRWVRSKSALDLKAPLNIVSTIDSVGGSSGSPVVNRSGELVGIIFDGNRAGAAAQYVYTAQTRTISVDARAIKEALKLYGASELAGLLGR